ncbi:unnamed protein product [Boreogadus saida]
MFTPKIYRILPFNARGAPRLSYPTFLTRRSESGACFNVTNLANFLMNVLQFLRSAAFNSSLFKVTVIPQEVLQSQMGGQGGYGGGTIPSAFAFQGKGRREMRHPSVPNYTQNRVPEQRVRQTREAALFMFHATSTAYKYYMKREAGPQWAPAPAIQTGRKRKSPSLTLITSEDEAELALHAKNPTPPPAGPFLHPPWEKGLRWPLPGLLTVKRTL